MRKIKYIDMLFGLLCCSLVTACEKFVSIDPPNFKLVTETVFASDETATATVTGIYNQLFYTDFANGGLYSVTVLSGMSSDIFETTSATDVRYGPFQQNEIAASESQDATANLNLWNSAYKIVYMANSVLEGLKNSETITPAVKKSLEGQALFIRAFSYFYLVNLYGDVPLILTTNYHENALASRDPASMVWEKIITDLDEALVLLEGINEYQDGERTRVNRLTVLAFRARVALYQQDWVRAETFSSEVIANSGVFELLEDLNQVFLKNSREAIWQISPIVVGIGSSYTRDGNFFRGHNTSPVKLANGFILNMDLQDKRLSRWVVREFAEYTGLQVGEVEQGIR